MRATAFAANTSASSVAKQFHRVLLLSALVVTASLNSLAQIAVSPASLTFAKTIVGTTSSSKPVTITNNGGSAQAVTIVMSGDFTETDNCSGSVAGGGGSCTAKISFAPTLVGAISGAASIYDGSNNLLAFVGLKGTGGAPVTTTPISLSFTGGTIGTLSAAQTFKITNNSSGSVNITSITASSDYQINTGTCLTTALAHAQYCTVSVQVLPTSATVKGAIIVTDNAPNAVPQVVKLSSSATGGSITPISLSKTSLTFKTVTGGTSATQSITVTNTSGGTLTLGTISASSYYAIVNNTCPASLAAAGTCTFGITFKPTFVGSIGGSAAVAYTGNNSPQVVSLSGSSLDLLTVAPTKLAFISQNVGTVSAAKALKITNNSASTVTLNSIYLSGDFLVQASGTTCLAGGTLLATKSCTLEVQFGPTIVGTIVGSVTVVNSAHPNPLLVPLAGSGTAQACTNNALLTGHYALMANGWDGATTATSGVGSFVADGAGNITGGLLDTADQKSSTGPQSGTFTGTYCVGSNNLATINLTYGGGQSGSNTFAAALDSSDSNGHIISYDTSSLKVSGLLRKQDTSAFSTGKIKGNYAFGMVGAGGGSAPGRFAMAGEFNSNGSGTLSGEVDAGSYSLSGLVNTTLSATDFSIASTGRGTATITFTGQGSVNFVFYVVSASEMLIMQAEVATNPGILAGQVLQQSGTFTNASLNGVGVFEDEFLDGGTTPTAEVGLFAGNGAGSGSVSVDENKGGTMSTFSASGIGYSTSSNGRVTLTGSSSVLYLIGPNQAFMVGWGGSSVDFGVIEPQSGSNFTNASLSGNYLGGSQQTVSANVGEDVDYVNADGAGNFTGTSDENGSGGPHSGGITATYSVSSNGRVVVTHSGAQAAIIYIISTSQFVFLPAGSSDTDPKLTQFQH